MSMTASSGELKRAHDSQPAVGVEVAVDLTAVLDHDEVCRRIPRIATQVADADRVALLSMETGDLVVEAAHDRDGLSVAVGSRFELESQPEFVEMMSSRQPRYGKSINVAGLPESLREAVSGVRHWLALPLEFEGEVLGFLVLQRRRDIPFDRETARLVQSVAMLASVSLRNARLFAETTAAQAMTREFLHVVAHELRAPLTVATGYVGMMREGVLGSGPPAWEHPLEMVEEKLAETQQLVEELLLAARLESGTVAGETRDVDLGGAARRAVDRAAPRAQLLDATLDFDERDGTVIASTDESHVDRILDNMINNALVHGGSPARITVTVGRDATPFVSVADRGEGVPFEEREQIFKRFSRGRRTARPGGSGLGLYLSRELAHRNGGSLELDTTYPRPGARFVLRLPDAHATPA